MDSLKTLCNDEPNEIPEIQTICQDNRDNACAINNMMDHNNSALLFCGGDTDGDGIGDYWDAFPNDPSETTDADNDGVGGNADAFPNDPSETSDTDGDGVGDNADAFPNDPSETTDTDGDGIGDNTDAFPNDPSETTDTDGDNIGDNTDRFPQDNNATTTAVLEASEHLLRTIFHEKYGCNP